MEEQQTIPMKRQVMSPESQKQQQYIAALQSIIQLNMTPTPSEQLEQIIEKANQKFITDYLS